MAPLYRFGDLRMPVRKPPLMLGEESEEVLSSSQDLDPNQIGKVRESGAI